MDYKDFYLQERYGGAKQEYGTWYHGTSMKRIPAIMSRGLDPNIPQEKRSWAEDPDRGPGSVDRSSYSGVYVTQNLMTARSSAWRTAQRDKSNQAIIIMQLQARSLIADEDDFANWFSTLAPHLGGSVYHHIYPYLWEVYGPPDYYKENHENGKKEWCNDTINGLFYDFKIANPLLKKHVFNMLYDEGYKAMLTRMVSHLKKSDYSTYWHWRKAYADVVLGVSRYGEDEAEIPDPPKTSEGEQTFRHFIDKLTRTMKHKARHNFTGKFGKTARSIEKIGFTGVNKIVAVVELVPSVTVKYSEDVKILYGELPSDFKQQWSSAVGEMRIVP